MIISIFKESVILLINSSTVNRTSQFDVLSKLIRIKNIFIFPVIFRTDSLKIALVNNSTMTPRIKKLTTKTTNDQLELYWTPSSSKIAAIPKKYKTNIKPTTTDNIDKTPKVVPTLLLFKIHPPIIWVFFTVSKPLLYILYVKIKSFLPLTCPYTSIRNSTKRALILLGSTPRLFE